MHFSIESFESSLNRQNEYVETAIGLPPPRGASAAGSEWAVEADTASAAAAVAVACLQKSRRLMFMAMSDGKSG